MSVPRIAVVGGGVSGLAVAYYLLKLQKESGKNFELTLLESADRLGGTIETEAAGGFVMEKGPDAFITDKPWALALSRELGLDSQIIGTNADNRRSFIAGRGKLLPVPEGFYLVAPLEVGAFLRSSIVSWPGKCRMMAEFFLPKKSQTSDESIAGFVRRRFGREALDRVAQAMLGGIYTGDPETLSLRATMPRFLELEQKYGSVTRGMMIEAKRRKSAASAASGPRYSLFSSFRGGMQTLTESLAGKLPPQCIRMGVSVQGIRYDAPQKRWQINFGNGKHENYEAVCIAASAGRAASFLKQDMPELAEKLSRISYESVMTLNLGYQKDQIAHPLNGFGFVVPKIENKTVIACSFSSRKFDGRAPADHVLLRAFIGGAFGRAQFEKSDPETLAAVKAELAAYLGIKGEPVLTRLKRYPNAMVQYGVGHLDLVSQIRSLSSRVQGLHLIGSNYTGVGIPDCVREAESEAQKIITSAGC